MFTVVTDLGSAHCFWFANGVEKMFVGSDQIHALAQKRGKVPEENLIKLGLPIRHDFAEQSEKLGDRLSPEGKAYQQSVQKELGLPVSDGSAKTILVMGGGEGVGSLANIVDALYCELVSQGIDAQILVVCGRNEKLKKSLDERNWNDVIQQWVKARERKSGGSRLGRLSIRNCGPGGPGAEAITCGSEGSNGGYGSSLRRIISTSSLLPSLPFSRSNSNTGTGKNEDVEEEKKCDGPTDMEETQTSDNMDASETAVEKEPEQTITEQPSEEEQASEDEQVGLSMSPTEDSPIGMDLSECNGNHFSGKVSVVGLGFVTRMAEYMVASDVLVSKAGPGTISEAAALSLPILLTSFLPGQEEGNVDFVVDNNFGAFCSDKDPSGIAEELCEWLNDEGKMKSLSEAAKRIGAPYAARDIAKEIGDRALKWKEINEKNQLIANSFSC